MSLALGIDIGATKTAYALVASSGVVLASHRIDTNVADPPGIILDRIASGIEAVMTGHDLAALDGVGIGSPGNIDSENGLVRLAVNLNWRDVPVTAELHNRVPNLPLITIDTDVQAWVAAERVFGVARDLDNFLYIALGTGFGATAVVNGKPVRGVMHSAMEIGHVIVQDSPRRRLEEFVSGIGMMTLYETLRGQFPQSPLAAMDNVTTREILSRAGDDLLVNAILDEMARWFGQGLAWACTAYNPQAVIVGGAFGQALMPHIKADVVEYLRDHTLPPIHEPLSFPMSAITESAVGPACLVWLEV